MKLNKKEIEILEFLLWKKVQAVEAAKALKIKKSNLSAYLKKLKKYRLVSFVVENKKRIVVPNGRVSFGMLEVKGKFPTLRLVDILPGNTPFLLSFILEKKKFRLKDVDLPPMSAKRILKKLRTIGIVYMPNKGNYELREEAYPVAAFCRELLRRMYIVEAVHELKKITYTKFSFDSAKELEVIFETDRKNDSKKYWPTSYSVFHKYGIRLMLAGKYYYSNKKPKIEDVVIHTLALSRDARSLIYVSAFMVKNKFDYGKLLKKRQHFDIPKGFIEKLIGFVESKEGFPSWKEVEEVAHGI
jgi:Mn-dependent DtxR family transcriptional regulator